MDSYIFGSSINNSKIYIFFSNSISILFIIEEETQEHCVGFNETK